MKDGVIGLPIVTAIGTLVVLIAGHFSPMGLRGMGTIRYWSVVAGSVMPSLLFLIWAFVGRKQSDDFALLMMFVSLVFLADCFIGLVGSFYLRTSSLWLRTGIGFGLGVVTMLWTLWIK